ncbi:ABC transporter ATP-binding protein [Clostridium gasigenes]|nr:ABC transporter ATP-binding protein [Clostridium gasigenes]MBB6622098.1 ABC transporter ATP-binding protein [Clostridium gasigenes]MBU3086937.1 ABC transporter ATP-binding protein [Clostridium gasigenes]MBU3131249.1 ABC transporter ATP-binding protein [Clostridium gasigenes]NKF08150.1 ABC transporter ATP-binding protein [Clostridium gasigenes]QSW18499.1 ABC transporter ATP-binding protein [Clostridium gasigenes]
MIIIIVDASTGRRFKVSSLIKIEGLSKSFGEKKEQVKVLKDINLEIKEGEILVVVGESGCGKTTLGKLIADVHKPTEGEIYYKGSDINKLKRAGYKDFRMAVQMVHQDSFAALNPNKNIFESLSAPILKHKIAKSNQEALELCSEYLEEVGLTPVDQFLYKYPHQLSGGQRQRILLARALLVKPKLIVADEPVSMVDVSLRISLLDLMASVNKKYGVSFVYITHDLATARYIANNGRVMVMYLGSVVELNNINDAITNPRHPYFKALLKAVPVANPRNKNMIANLPLKTMDIPNLKNLPNGCKFNPRCIYANELCEIEEPTLRKIGDGFVACHHAETIEDDK